MALAVVVSGCAGDDGDDDEPAGLTPTFAPESPDASDAPASSTTTATSVIVLGGSEAVPPSANAAPAANPPVEVAITDPEGDATASPIDPPPPWADLVGARLMRSDTGFELRIRLAGGDAPESTDDDHTMNVASFYDVDGDGVVDYEVWANVASGGWGAAYYTNGGEGGGFGDGAGVEVTTEGDEVVLRFPHSHLADASRFRWSTASEWGRYEALGTPAMVRDDAPDDDAPAAFPA